MMQKKKRAIIYIITKLELGGAQKVCLSLFNQVPQGTHADDWETFLITSDQGILLREVADNAHVITLPTLQREVRWGALWSEIKNFFALRKELKKVAQAYAECVVHTHSTKAGLVGRWAALCAGIKHRVHTVHGYAFHDNQPWSVWLPIYLCELLTSFVTTHFVCVSSADMRMGERLFPWFMRKCSLIRAAVDTRNFYIPAHKIEASELDHNDISAHVIVGTVACFKPQKNLFDLLQAFEYAYQKNNLVRLEIIGDGILRPALEAWIHEHQLASVITLHGWQSDVAPIMAQWDIFALSSLWEGLPCAIVEARLLKIPVLSYDTGGIRDVIVDGVNGYVYPQKAWQQLGEGILTLSYDRALYARLALHKDDLEAFENMTMVKQHQDLYQMLQK